MSQRVDKILLSRANYCEKCGGETWIKLRVLRFDRHTGDPADAELVVSCKNGYTWGHTVNKIELLRSEIPDYMQYR